MAPLLLIHLRERTTKCAYAEQVKEREDFANAIGKLERRQLPNAAAFTLDGDSIPVAHRYGRWA